MTAVSLRTLGRMLRRLLSDKRGSSDLQTYLLLTAAGCTMVGLVAPSMFNSSQKCSNTFDKQVQVLERGASPGGGGGMGGMGGVGGIGGGLIGFMGIGGGGGSMTGGGGSLTNGGGTLNSSSADSLTPGGAGPTVTGAGRGDPKNKGPVVVQRFPATDVRH
jgi:hypothetical protein